MQEYRTGKLDVREAAAKRPERAPDAADTTSIELPDEDEEEVEVEG